MSEKTKVNITPDKSLIQKLGLTGYKTEQAIAELIDNSIDARFPGKIEQIDVILNYESNAIRVIDDGSGMDLKELENALTIAKSSRTDVTQLGKFGLGMKSACSTLGKSFRITTSKINSEFEYVAQYDEDKWLDDKSLDWSNFEIEKIKKSKNSNGTSIIISKLKIPLYPNQTSRFKKRYGIRYGPHLQNKQIRLRINSRPCESAVPVIQKDSKRELDIKLPSGNHLTGWIGLLEKRSIKGDYGIHLFKNGRLINAFADFGFSRHPEVAKIMGEISLDHVPVNFHKTGFIEDSLEYKEAKNGFKNNEIVKNTLKTAGSQGTSLSSLEPIFDDLSGKSGSGAIDTKISATNAKELLQKAESFTLHDQNHVFNILFVDGKNEDELYFIDNSSETPVVVINRDHLAFKTMKNPIFLIGLIYTEVKLLLKNKSVDSEFLRERNKNWTTFLNKWSNKEETQGRTKKVLESESKYLISSDLTELIDYLESNFEHNFQFTGLSTLYAHLQNAYGKIVYHLHTVKGSGQQLQEIVGSSEHGKIFVILLNPNRTDLQNAMDFSEKNKFIVIREYAEKPTTQWASAEKAWLDLYSESKKNLLLIPHNEVFIILGNLLESHLINVDKLKSLAKHRHQLDEILEFLEND